MLFNSIEYALFLPIVCLLYYKIPERFKKYHLLIASYLFYICWNPWYSLLLLFSTLLTYFCGICLDMFRKELHRKMTLVITIVTSFGLLFLFKYYTFFNTSMVTMLNSIGVQAQLPNLSLLLPVGISFYTFQSVGYTIDVYRSKLPAEKDFVIYALFVSFFPQLAAGPIQRSTSLINQLKAPRRFEYDKVTLGLKTMAIGFIKKMVIADTLAVQVNLVFNQIDLNNAATYVVAAIFFTFQIYCDFSGYSDIAIGSAKVLGIDLSVNFNKPYFTRSIAEFWRCWHISLSSWFRDYLYFPLGGNRVSKIKWYRNIIVVFLVSGLWHGANWTYVIWGLLHGSYQIMGSITSPIRRKVVAKIQLSRLTVLHSFIQGLITFVFVCAAWIFFRANTIFDAIHIFKSLFGSIAVLINPYSFADLLRFGSLRREQVINCSCFIGFLLLYDTIDWKFGIWNIVGKMKPFIRVIFYIVVVYSFFWFMSTSSNEFIYVQF